jgi:MFS family permease
MRQPTHFEDPRGYPRPSVAWYSIGVLLVFFVFSGICNTVVGLLVEPIRQTFRVDDFQVSLLGGVAFTLVLTTLGFLFGKLVDVGSRRSILAGGVLLWSLATIASGLAKDFQQLFLARVVVAAGEAALAPATFSFIADSFPPSRRAFAMSLYSMGLSIGVGISFLVGGMVAGVSKVGVTVVIPFFGAIPSWQVVFLLIGIPSLLSASLVLTLQEPERKNEPGVQTSGKQTLRAFLGKEWKSTLALIGGYGLFNVYGNSMAFWGATQFIRTYGWTPKQVGIGHGLIAVVAGSLSLLFGGKLSDYFRGKGMSNPNLRTLVVCAVGLLVWGIPLQMTENGMIAIGCYAGVAFFAIAPEGAASAAVQELAPNHLLGQFTALFFFVRRLLGGTLGPILVGLCTDHLFGNPLALRYSLLLVGIPSVIASLILYRLGFKKIPQKLTLTPRIDLSKTYPDRIPPNL